MTQDVKLYIAGAWRGGGEGRTLDFLNPATGERAGTVACATIADLDEALAAAEAGFAAWGGMSPYARGKVMRRAAVLLRERTPQIARLMSLEQGKPLAEARMELERGADVIDWMAGEGERLYGRLVPGRTPDVDQFVIREGVGPVAAFTPWNFPVNQLVRKVAGALSAGCSLVVKAAEETPASCAALVAAFADAGVPAGTLNLVFGDPAEISGHLIAHPVVRKVSFTGSTAVGKLLAALAGRHMKRVTMELGGHAPVLVFADADIEAAAAMAAASKFRNAGQTCISPTRFIVEAPVYSAFTEALVRHARALTVGDGLDPATTMGPLANPRRVTALEDFVADAVDKGARVACGGTRIGERGFFFAPTVLADVPLEARVMSEEPFGPIALVRPFEGLEAALAEANRLPYGLAAYAFTTSASTARALSRRVESGMLGINSFVMGNPETPFGGMKDSGYGYEGGSEAIEAYLQTRLVTIAGLD